MAMAHTSLEDFCREIRVNSDYRRSSLAFQIFNISPRMQTMTGRMEPPVHSFFNTSVTPYNNSTTASAIPSPLFTGTHDTQTYIGNISTGANVKAKLKEELSRSDRDSYRSIYLYLRNFRDSIYRHYKSGLKHTLESRSADKKITQLTKFIEFLEKRHDWLEKKEELLSTFSTCELQNLESYFYECWYAIYDDESRVDEMVKFCTIPCSNTVRVKARFEAVSKKLVMFNDELRRLIEGTKTKIKLVSTPTRVLHTASFENPDLKNFLIEYYPKGTGQFITSSSVIRIYTVVKSFGGNILNDN